MAEDRLMVSVSGVRGTIGGTMTPQVALSFGCAFARYVGPGKTVTLARDSRVSGPMLRSAIAAGLTAGGVHAVDLGIVSTPGAALMTLKLKAAGGVVVTASHNPPPYNGIKFLQPNGPSLRATDAERLKELWQTGDFQLVDVHGIGRISEDTTTHDAHVEAVCDITDVDAINAADFHVVVDSINGAGCEVTPMLLARLGCDLSHVNGEPTGEFAHEPEPIAKNLTQLGKLVQASGAHVGFAQDPDADRLVVLDEKGRFIGEEYTLALTAAFVLRHRKGKLAANMVTSRMIDDLAEAAGVEVVRAPTGEANVVEAMEREGCIFGGEGNGGVIDPRVVPVRDSLVGMAMILQYMAETGKPLSQLADDIPSYTMLKTKMPCPPGAAEAAAEQVRKAFGDETGVRFSDLDGLRVDLPGGWVSVRPSNTEPILRVMAEASDAKLAQDLLDRVQQIASQAAKP